MSADPPVVDDSMTPADRTGASAPPAPEAAATPAGAMIRTLGLVSALCGLIIVGAYQGTLGAVAANKRIALERSVFKVIPTARSIAEFDAVPGQGVRPAGKDAVAGAIRFFAAYDAAGQLAGIAAEGSAKGYADNVRIMFGYDPGHQRIAGISVVAMRETPGIGDKILTDQEFLANFSTLDVRLNRELSALANDVKTVKHGSKTNPWQIDAISGATITSRAVGRAINDAAQALLPMLAVDLDKVKEPR